MEQYFPTKYGNFQSLLHKFVGYFKSAFYLISHVRWYAIYRIDLVRYLICRVRKFYFIKIKKSLITWDGNNNSILVLNSGDDTIAHNLKGLHDVSCARSLRIIKPLSVIETFRPLSEMPYRGGTLYDLDYACDAKVLTIGPRTEGEIFCLRAYGFKAENIRGLDLISYSPYVDVGDMHKMDYEDSSFDIVIASCVLVYSIEPEKACQEVIRIVKDKGIVCISQDTNCIEDDQRSIASGKNIMMCKDYLEYFENHVGRIFYQHEIPERLKFIENGEGSCYTTALIFQIEKGFS